MIRLVVSSSGRTRRAAVQEFLREREPSAEAVLVGATRDAVDDLVAELSLEIGATFGLHRFSLSQLVAHLAALPLAAEGLVPASSLGSEAVAARAAFEAEKEGRLPELSAVSRFPGFPRALAGSLGDLRLAGLDAKAVDGHATELAALLTTFERQLTDAAIADRSLLYERARMGLRDSPLIDLGSAALILLDITLDSAIETRFIKALCETAQQVLATVPTGDDPTLAAYQSIDRLETVRPDEEQAPGRALSRLRTYLFSDDSPPSSGGDDEVHFFSAPGEGRECVEIARHALVEARRNVRFDEMAVFVRAPELYHTLLETALSRAGVPAYFARGTRRPDPSGRALLALLACAAEGLSARRFAEYLSFAQLPRLTGGGPPPVAERRFVPPEDESIGVVATPTVEVPRGVPGQLTLAFDEPSAAEPEPEPAPQDSDGAPTVGGTLRAPWKWEELLVEAAVIGGLDRWERRLDGLRGEWKLKLDEMTSEEPDSPRLLALERDLDNLGHLQRFALPVIGALADLPTSATWGEWLEHLARLAPRVLRHPDRLLAVLAELEPMAAVGPILLDEVRGVLAERFSTIERDRPDHRYGRLFVATPDQARGRSFKVVFVPGLAERVFPQRPREDPLLLDDLRRELSPELATQEDRGHRERLRLRLAVGAAEERIYLSYPRIEVAEARPRVPSFYGLDVARATEGQIPDLELLERQAAEEVDARLAWPAPPDPTKAIDAIEHDLAVLGPLLHNPDTESVKGRARYLLELSPHLGRSLRSRWARWETGKWSQFDGIVRVTDATRPALEANRLTARPYSVTALEKFAACPYRFLLSAIYRLQPREEVAALVNLDPLTRGAMFHRIQTEALSAMKDQGLLPVTPDNLDRARPVLDEAIERIVKLYRDELAPAIERVWLDEIDAMRADLRSWLRHVADHQDWIPEYFELSFGHQRFEERDPASVPDPVTLESGWQLRGSADLVERNAVDDTLRVTDHKTGRDRTTAGLMVNGGETLQPVLYSLAVEQITGREVAQARLFFCTARGGFGERVVPVAEFPRHYAEEVLKTIDESIGEGHLPPAPRQDACRFCDFRPVCGPWEELRTQRKGRALIENLQYLRDLP